MEAGNFVNEEKEKSPSHGNTAHFQTTKVESLEDFEEITKDEPSLIDVTAQFLQFETNSNFGTSLNEDINFQHDQCDLKIEEKDDPAIKFNYEGQGQMSEGSSVESYMNPNVEITEVDSKTSSNSLLVFEDSFSQSKFENEEESLKEKSLVNILDENKLNDVISNDEISTGSDYPSFIPQKGESSPVMSSDYDKEFPKKPVSECKSTNLSDSSSATQTLSKFTSEPRLSREQELEVRQGDGLPVTENFEADASDDEIAPEPIPKDYPEIGVIEGKQFLAAIGLDTWFHPHQLNPKVESLIYWRDPKKSGVVFGSVLVILLSLTTFSLISVLAHTSLLVLVAALAFRIYKSVLQAVQKTSEGHPFKAYFDAVVNHPIITTVFLTIEEYLDVDLTLNPEKAREVSDVVISQVNKILTKCRSLFLVEDVIDSVKFAILLWCLTYVGAWFNGLSLLIIAFVGLFTLPKVYENNKTQIDANIDVVKSKINDVSEKIRAVVPLGKKIEEVKDKGE